MGREGRAGVRGQGVGGGGGEPEKDFKVNAQLNRVPGCQEV